jgi:putative sigma-54 modulation protein
MEQMGNSTGGLTQSALVNPQQGDQTLDIQIKGKSTDISDDLRLFTERKIGKLQRFFSRGIVAQVTLSEQPGKKGSKTHRAEVVMHIKGKVISAREDTENFFIAVDAVVEKLRRQLKKEKSKWLEKTKDIREAPPAPPEPLAVAVPGEPVDLDTLEVRQFALKPMSIEEALAALDGAGQPFFLFVNNEQTINCVYRRADGNYGLMVPESALVG